LRNLSEFIAYHFAVIYFAETPHSVLATYRYGIQSRQRIIMSLHANASAMLDSWVEHGFRVKGLEKLRGLRALSLASSVIHCLLLAIGPQEARMETATIGHPSGDRMQARINCYAMEITEHPSAWRTRDWGTVINQILQPSLDFCPHQIGGQEHDVGRMATVPTLGAARNPR